MSSEVPAIGECPGCGDSISGEWENGHDCPECGRELGVGWL